MVLTALDTELHPSKGKVLSRTRGDTTLNGQTLIVRQFSRQNTAVGIIADQGVVSLARSSSADEQKKYLHPARVIGPRRRKRGNREYGYIVPTATTTTTRSTDWGQASGIGEVVDIQTGRASAKL